jgi:hypothetical protein
MGENCPFWLWGGGDLKFWVSAMRGAASTVPGKMDKVYVLVRAAVTLQKG